jgi:hypothetical protein
MMDIVRGSYQKLHRNQSHNQVLQQKLNLMKVLKIFNHAFLQRFFVFQK